MPKLTEILASSAVLAALRQAWQDSNPGLSGGREQGGFIAQDTEGGLTVLRWPTGAGASILVPARAGCKIHGMDIVATFHTHPNTGSDYLQEPSETDRRAIRDDPDLKGKFYQGELVVAQGSLYLITPQGTVLELGNTATILAVV